MKMKILLVTAVIVSSHLYSQDSTKNLNELVVTATKFPLKQSQTGKVVSVIDQQTLQRNAGRSLTELINYQAGIFINGANNVLGTNPDVYLRGAASGNTLVLIDGIPVSDPSRINNSFDLNSITIPQIERIEILKGAQSTLWGSDAVAGVINIITKKSGLKKFTPVAGISYGSYQTFKANAGINGMIDAFNYSLNYTHTNSKGFSSAHDSTGNDNFDNDGFQQDNFQANIGYRFTPAFSVSAMSSYGKYKTDLDGGAFKDDKDYTSGNTNLVHSFTLVYKVNKNALHFTNTWINAKRSTANDTTGAAGNGEFYRDSYTGRSVVSELFGNFFLAKKWSLVSGVQRIGQNTDQSVQSYSREYAFGYSSKLGQDLARSTNYAVYASLLLLDQNGFNAEAGIRYNNHSIYGNNVTYTFNPSYNINDNARVFVNISSAYKIPSLYQLFSEYGNQALKPEESNNYELGMQGFSNNKKNSLRVVGFKRDIRNVIIFYSDPVTYASQYINRDQQYDYGFELESNIAIGKTGSWLNNLTYVTGEGKTANTKVKNFYRRPNFSFNSTLTWAPAKGLTIMPSFRFVGKRLKGKYDLGPEKMAAYYTVDLYTGYKINHQFNVFIDLRNMTDQTYFDIVGYNSRRVNFTIGINAAF